MSHTRTTLAIAAGDLPTRPITSGSGYASIRLADEHNIVGDFRDLQAWFAEGLRLVDDLVRARDAADDEALRRAQDRLDRERSEREQHEVLRDGSDAA